MLKIKNAYLIGLIAASLLVGCGGGSDSDNEANEATEQTENGSTDNGTSDTNQPTDGDNGTGGSTDTPTPPPTSNAKKFTSDVMPVLNAKCKSCHGDNGNFTITTPAATYANISDLKASVSASGMYLLNKGSNSIGHGGGKVIPTDSAEYQTIKSWVDSGADFN